MELQLEKRLEMLFNNLPPLRPQLPTFFEIAGFPHYENVCSNVLAFFLQPGTHGLTSMLVRALVKDIQLKIGESIIVKREAPTAMGRLDLIIIAQDWIIAIENKIYHHLNNDLEEYANHLDRQFQGRKIYKIVLSVRPEVHSLKGNFENVLYEQFIKTIEGDEIFRQLDHANDYHLYFLHFFNTIKNICNPITMEKQELEFLKKYWTQIKEVQEMNTRLEKYINQRAHNILKKIVVPAGMEKWVYAGHDVGFHYTFEETRYKLECPIDIGGINIIICVESRQLEIAKLEKLEIFKDKDAGEYRKFDDHRLFLEEGIDFLIPDNELVEKLNSWLRQFRVVDTIK